MADFDGDANATPLAKLPAPMMQGNRGMPSASDKLPNYSDMMKAAQHQLPPPAFQAPPPQEYQMPQQPQHQPQHQPQPQPQHQPQQMHQMHQMMMPPQQPEVPRARKVRFADEYQEDEEDYRVPDRPKKRKPVREGYAAAYEAPWWHKYKPGLLVAAIVFFMLMYGVPRVKVSVPYFVTPTGRLNAMGLGSIALLCGALFQGGSRFV